MLVMLCIFLGKWILFLCLNTKISDFMMNSKNVVRNPPKILQKSCINHKKIYKLFGAFLKKLVWLLPIWSDLFCVTVDGILVIRRKKQVKFPSEPNTKPKEALQIRLCEVFTKLKSSENLKKKPWRNKYFNLLWPDLEGNCSICRE